MRAILSTLVITLIAVAAPACGSGETGLGGGDDQGVDSFGGADGATLADGQGSGGASDATTADVAPPTPDAPPQPDPGPQDTAAPPSEDVSDAAVPPSPDPDAGFGPEDVAEPEPEGDAAIEGCEEGQVVNCEGGCTPADWLGDAWCDPVFDCEALDFDNGDCVPVCGDGSCGGEETYTTCPEDCVAPVIGDNHPCEVSEAPGSNDPDITACACAQDAWCCTNTWDSFCVQLADGVCGATCDCSEESCEADADCGACFGNACVGEWTCDEGMCVQGEPVVCDDPEAVGCLTAQCDPETGACVTAADSELCDDSSACTIDSCDGETGACTYAPSDVCGDQHPCAPAISPGNGDPDVQACVCDLDAYCCNSAWDAACIDEAQANCGLVCNCLEASEEALACETNADCAWCGESACTGIFVCEEGTCQATAPVVCDTSEDAACSKTLCNPDTGACGVYTDVVFCDDDDPCTADACDADTGACSYEAVADCGMTHPCEASAAPASSDPEVNTCVCAIAPNCCESQWQAYCIEIAVDHCDLSCDCTTLDPEVLTCVTDAECAYCDDGDLCNGGWSCQEGVCAQTSEVSCDTSGDSGCVVTACNPESGACEHLYDASLCDDANPCTDDLCDEDTGTCVSEENASCGLNHPCVSAPFPTSSDPEVTECVCAIDDYCCATAWDTLCVEKAEENCEQTCTCDDPEVPVACGSEADCAGCDDGDLCNGTWGCVDGLCAALDDAVVCDPADDNGCLINACVSPGGVCELMPDVAACDDGDPCTTDACQADGACVSTLIEGCTLNHPCATSDFPESSDPDITTCVCALDPWCCENTWDEFCVSGAQDDCGAICDCADPAADLACAVDQDCGWCSDNLCEAPWSCVDGQCAPGDPVSCDAASDTECQLNQCDPATGACALVSDPTACDDADPCTIDSCNAAGACEHQAIIGCQPEPPFECLGTAEPSAEGCGLVASYEGCCDPWGRVTWCQDGATYCISCEANPSCGWQSGQGYYDCGTDGSEDPTGAAPKMCMAFSVE